VWGNMPLIEIGLIRMYADDKTLRTMTDRWKRFLKDEISMTCSEQFTPEVEEIFFALSCDATESAVKTELKVLIHELSKAHHRIKDIPGHGIFVGGEEPPGCAVAVGVVALQRRNCLNIGCRFVGPDYVDKKLFSDDGQIEQVWSLE
jgi:hypothetical protein